MQIPIDLQAVELEVSHANLAGAVETRISGHQGAADDDEQGSRTHYENSRFSMERGQQDELLMTMMSPLLLPLKPNSLL